MAPTRAPTGSCTTPRGDRQLVEAIPHRQHLGLGRRQLAADGRDCPRYLPTAFALPIVQQLEVFAEAEYIAGANVNCEFNCADVLGYLGRWLMFSTPLPDLLAGTTYPDTVNAYNPADPTIPCNRFGPADEGAHLEPLMALQAIADYLMQDPSENPVILPDPGGVLSDAGKLGLAYLNDYNPLVTGSFLYWGAPTLYSVPALLAGLVQNITGIPNQFIETPQWKGEIDVASGAPYEGHENAGPLDPAFTRSWPAGGDRSPGAGSTRIPGPRAHTSGLAWGTPC